MTRRLSIGFVGDVVTRPFSRIRDSLPGFTCEIEHHEIDQIYQVLARGSAADVLIVHASSDSFLDEASPAQALASMDAFCRAVAEFAARESTLVVVNTLERLPQRVVGTHYLDELELLASLNRKVFELARSCDTVSIVDVGAIAATLGVDRALNMQNRLVMRLPYTKLAIDALVAAYAQAIRERFVARKKVVVVDADNTLWGGIVGEDGVEGIDIDRQYPGAVHRRFQRQLLELSSTGVLLALVSKNDLADVRAAFERREMPLKLEHFATIQANWEPKSQNIRRVARDLNLGTDSIVFIDDSPFELDEVQTALPEVEVYRFDARRADEALKLLASIDGLKAWSVTDEDRAKTQLYRDERKRAEVEKSSANIEEYLRTLDIRLEIGRNRRSQVKRIAQLTNKTNQFNLTTKRYSEADVLNLMDTAMVFDVRLQDRFGDMGVIGVVIVVGTEIDTFLLSCRALGRGVEKRILVYICRKLGDAGVQARYVPTAKNAMTARFYDDAGFTAIADEGVGGTRYQLVGGHAATMPTDIPVAEVD